MAKGINIPVTGDVRPLQKQIAKATKTPIKLGGIDDRSFTQPLGRIKGQMGEFQKSLEASNARVIAFGASAGAIMAIQQAFKSLVTTVVNVEKKLAEVNVILGTNQRNLSRFGSELFSIAKKTEQSFDAVATAATELARQGLGLELTLKRTKDAMILTRLAGISVVDSVESITAALNGFNKAALNSTKVINKIIAVDQAFAVSGKDLAEALKRVGSTAQDAGVSLDELMAVVTTAQQITARGGAVIGNSFKTIFTRIQRPKVVEALQAVGVATKDLAGNSLSAIKVLENLAGQFDRLSQSQRSQVAELVGGVFQINVLKAALSDLGKSYSIYDRALKTSLTSADEAQRRNAILNKTLAASANELVVNLQKVGATVGKLSIEPVLRRVLGGVNKALNSLDVGESEGIGAKIGEGIFKGIGSFLKGPGLALAVLGIFKLFEKLRTFASDAFKTMTGLNQTQSRQAEIQKNIAQYLQNNPKLLNQIKRGTLSVEQVHEKILNKIKQETIEMQNQARVASKISGALYARGVRVKGADSPDEGRLYTASKGHIPNFSRADRIASAVEISSASYAKPSTKVIKSKQPGLGTYYRNSEETITRVPGYRQHFVNPPLNSSEGRKHKINSIRKTGINPYSWNGTVPNFAKTGVYDSDFIDGGGMSKNAKSVLAAIISSGKRVNSVWGPAGSGKSTWAKSKFGGVPITDASQVGKYQDFVVLYGGGRSKKGGLTAQGQQVLGASARSGGQIYALVPKGGNMEIMNRRDRRVQTGSADLRTKDQLKNTKRAPVWNYSFLSEAKKQYPSMQIVRNQDGFVPSFAKRQRKLLHLTPETFTAGGTITDNGYSITAADGSKGYLAIKGMNKDILSKLVTKPGYSTNPQKAKLRDAEVSNYLNVIKGHLGMSEVSTPIGRKELLSLASSPRTGIVGAPSNIFSVDNRSGASEEARIKSQLFIGGPDLFENIPVAVGTFRKGSEIKTKMGHTKGGEEFPLTGDFHSSTQARELHRLVKKAVEGRSSLSEIIEGFDQFAKAADPDVRMLKKGLGFEDFLNLSADIKAKLKRDSEVLDFYPYTLNSFPESTKEVLNLNPKSGYGDAKLNPTEENQVGLAQKWLRWKAQGASSDQMSEWLRGIIEKNQTIDYKTRQEPANKQIALVHSGTGDNEKEKVSVTLSKLTSGSGAQDFKAKYAGLFEADDKKGGARVPAKYKSTSARSKAFGFQFILDAVNVPDTVGDYLDELAESDPAMIERLKSQYVKKMKELVSANKSQGYIPNFADPLSAAIMRESGSVSSSKIRVGQDNRLKSSSNPAGLGVFNTRDEPRGLGQGISRARREGRNPRNYGASKGLVPNFAAPAAAGFFARNFAGKGLSADETASIDKFQDSVFKASFAFGTLTSTLGTVIGESQSAAAATSKATDAMTNAGTAVQLIPGPAGKVVGAFVLAGGAVSAMASAFQSVGDEIAEENERLKGVTQTASDNLAKYGEAFSAYVEEVSKGTTDTRRVNDLQKKMLESLQDIPAAYRAQLLSARNLTDVQQKIAQAQEQMAKRSMQVNIGATVAKAMDDALGMGDLFGRNVGLDDDIFKGAKGGALLGQFNVDLVRTLDMDGLIARANQLGGAFNFTDQSSQKFIDTLRNQYGLQGEVAKIMDEMSDAEIKKVQSALEDQVRQQARAKKEFEALNRVLQANATVTNRIREAAASATAALRTFITSGLESMKGSRGREFQRGSDQRALRLERAKAGVSLAEGVLSKDLKLALETQIATLERQEKYYVDAEKIMAEGRTKLAEAVRKITEIQPKSKGGSGQQAATELSPEMAQLQRGLLGVLRQTESAGLAETRKAFDDFVKANQTAFRGKNYEAESIAVLKEQSNKLLELKASQEQANRIAEIQTNVQKKLLQVQRDTATAGGIDKFIEGAEKSFDRRIEFVEKLSKFAGFAQVGLTKQESSAGLELNRSIRDFLGGLNVDDPNLRRIAVRGRAQDIRDESGFRIQQIQSIIPQLISSGRTDAASSLQRQALALQGVRNRAGQIAQRQVDEEVKTKSLPQEIANLISEIKVLNREQASLDTKLGTSLQAAIVQSQMPSLLDKINQQAININDNLILQQKQEEKNAAKAELETKNVRLQEAEKSRSATRRSINDLFSDTDIELAGTNYDLELEGPEVGKFTGVIERFVAQAQKMGVLSEGQGIEALSRSGTADLAKVLGGLSASDRKVLEEEARVGVKFFGDADAGADLRNLFGGLMKDTSGFGQKLNQLAMDITTIETIKPTVNDLQQNLQIASDAVAQFQNDIRRNRPAEQARGRTQTRFGDAANNLRGAIQERGSISGARGTLRGITQGLQQGDIRGAQTAVASLAQGVARGTISRGEMERQLTAVAQATGVDAGELISQVDAVSAARPGRARAQAGARLMGTLTGMSRRGIRGTQIRDYAQGMSQREGGANAQIASKIGDLQREATTWDNQFKTQFARNYWGAPDITALRWDRLNNIPNNVSQDSIEQDWKSLVELGRKTKITSGFGQSAYARQSAQVQTQLSRLLTNPSTAGLRNVEKLFNEISNTSALKRFQSAAQDYKRENARYAFGGFVPNFEKTMAKSMGAPSDVKAHMGQGTIGGKRFMMNNYETEIARPGNDSYVIPSYAGGYVPNFNLDKLGGEELMSFEQKELLEQIRRQVKERTRLPRKPDRKRTPDSAPTVRDGTMGGVYGPEGMAMGPRPATPQKAPGRIVLDEFGGVAELYEELEELARRGGGTTMSQNVHARKLLSGVIVPGVDPTSPTRIQTVDITDTAPSSSRYFSFMQELGFTSPAEIGRNIDDSKLIARFDDLNDLIPGKRVGDTLLENLRSSLAGGGDNFFRDNKGLIELLKGGKDGTFEKLKSMSLNMRKDKSLANYIATLLENGQAGKVAKFVQGYQIPDKYKIKPGYREQYREWLEKKKKERDSKARSAKNDNWIKKHGIDEIGVPERAAMIFEPPKKGAIDRMVDFKPSNWIDAFMPFSSYRYGSDGRTQVWLDWVESTKRISGSKAPLNQLISATKAGIDPIEFASQVISGKMPYDQFMEEKVGADKKAKAEAKARKATEKLNPNKKKSVREIINENIDSVREGYENFKNRGENPVIDEAEMADKSAGRTTTDDGRKTLVDHDSKDGRTGPEGETRKSKADLRRERAANRKAWIKKQVLERGARWRQRVSDLDTRWAQHTRGHPNQYKGLGSFHTDPDAKFRGARVAGKELGVGILATAVINKLAGGNVPDYDRKEAVRKYGGAGFSPDPVGVLDVLMDKLPFIGTKSLKASDISAQGLLKDAASVLLPPPASLMMMSLEEMHRQWFQTVDMVQRTKEDIMASDNRAASRSSRRRVEVGEAASADVKDIEAFKNKIKLMMSKGLFYNKGDKLPGGVKWGTGNTWPTFGSSELVRKLTGYEHGMKKRAGLKTVISRQEHLQTLANRYIEAKPLVKSKGIYEVDNEPESAFNLLFNLDKIAGRTVQYSSIKALKMGKGAYTYPNTLFHQINRGGSVAGSRLSRSPMDPIRSKAKLVRKRKGNKYTYDFPNPKGAMWGLFPSRQSLGKIGTSKATTSMFQKMHSTMPFDELLAQAGIQANVAGANANAGAAIPAAPQMNTVFTGGNVAAAASAWWRANGQMVLTNFGGGNAPRVGGKPWDSDMVKQLVMNVPVNAKGTTWRSSQEPLPVALANALGAANLSGPDITKVNLGNIIRMSRAQWLKQQSAMQQEVAAATAGSRRPTYKPTDDVDRTLMQRNVANQKTAASFLYKLANQHIKPNPLSQVGFGPTRVPNNRDPYNIAHPDNDTRSFNDPNGNPVNNRYRPLHDYLNDPARQPARSRRTLTGGGVHGTPLGFHMKNLFNSGHKGYFDPLALMMLGRTHGIIDRVRTSSNATLSTRPNSGIGFPNVSDFLSEYSSAAAKAHAGFHPNHNSLQNFSPFSKASPNFRKNAGGPQSELFQFFANKGRFDKIVAFGGHIPNFAYNFDPSIFGGTPIYGSRGLSGTNYFDMLRNPGFKAFGVGMFDYMVSGRSMLGQLARGRRDYAGNNIRQEDINAIIARTPEYMGMLPGGFSGFYTPGRGNFGPQINYGAGATGNIVGHERFHAVFDQAQVGSFFGANAMRFQSRNMLGSMRARSDVANIFDTGSAYNFGMGVRRGSLGMTVDSINEMLAFSMMGAGRGGANRFAQGKFDTRLRGSALRSLGGFNDRQAVKAFSGAAQLAGGGDFFDGMMMFEELASKRYFGRGYLPNFNIIADGLRREARAMPPGATAKVGYDSRLNGGIGIYNSSEGSLKNAIDMHMSAGKSISQIQRAGSSSYNNSGPVPNFAEGTIAQSLSSLAQQTGGTAANTGLDTSEVVNLLSEMVNGIGGLSSVVSTGFETQSAAFSEGMQNVNIGGSLPVNVTLGGTVQDASAAIVNQLQTKVNAFMSKALTPAQQGEVNAMTRFGDRQG